MIMVSSMHTNSQSMTDLDSYHTSDNMNTPRDSPGARGSGGRGGTLDILGPSWAVLGRLGQSWGCLGPS